ncbi:MAG TPA: TQO small subunit DoxD [Candidatus Limnocylindrales bacterium]
MQSKGRGTFLLRIALGYGFLFAGLDKFLDLAGSGKAFTAAGFLKFATGGAWVGVADPKAIVNPTHGFWVSLASNASLIHVIDTLVVFGEIAIGVALILGLATRFAGVAGTLMMALFYVANWGFGNGLVNEQFMYGAVAAYLAYVGAGAYALDSVIEKLAITQRIPAVRYVLG